jgi:signal transduction histidine kinase
MRKRPWLLLVIGLGSLLLIMAVAEAGALISLVRLRGDGAQLQARFLDHDRRLEEIRSHLYLSGTYARDYILAPDSAGAGDEMAALVALRKRNEAELDDYAKSLEPEEVQPFRALRAEIDSYWKMLDRTFTWTPQQRDKYRYVFFYNELISRRTLMLQIADRIAAVNAESLRRGSRKLDEMFGRLQMGMQAMIVITLLGGATLAGFITFYTLRLEGEARRRYDESVKAREDLQELSAKLVRMQEDERRALSRELHDEIGQSLSAILMEAENLLDMEPEQSKPRLKSLRALAEKTVNEIRDMALLLRPSMLDDFGLVPALTWQAREMAKRTGLSVQVAAGELPEELPDEHKTCIYRVVQEALTNCARHARATTVQVSVKSVNDRILLSVQDDGAGFDPRRGRGLGLLGMEERIRRLGGLFVVDSSPGRGTTLKVELPLASLTGRNGHGADSHSAGG